MLALPGIMPVAAVAAPQSPTFGGTPGPAPSAGAAPPSPAPPVPAGAPAPPAPGSSANSTSSPPTPAPVQGAGAALPPPGPPSAPGNQSYSIDIPVGSVIREVSGQIVAEGQITIHYRGGTVTGQRLVFDPRTRQASLTGDVRMQSGGQAYEAASADFNLSSRLFSITSFTGTIAPSALQYEVTEPVRVTGDLLGNDLRGEIQVQQGRVTTCDPPDYYIDAKSITIVPGQQADFRDAAIYLFGRRILKVNRLTVSLRPEQRNQFLPAVGEDQVEGYYVKERYPVGLGAAGAGLLLLDLMSKKGFGKGFQDAYHFLRGSGEVQLYQIHARDTGSNDLNGSLTDTRRIGDISTNLNANYSKNSYTQQFYTGSSQTAFNGTLGINRNTPNNSTDINLSLNRNNSGVTNSSSLSEYIRQHFGFGRGLSADMNYSRQFSAFSSTAAGATNNPATGQNEYQFTLTESAPALTTVLASDVHQPFGSRGSFFFVERYPEVTFTTTSARLLPLKQLPTGRPTIPTQPPQSIGTVGPFGPLPTPPTPPPDNPEAPLGPSPAQPNVAPGQAPGSGQAPAGAPPAGPTGSSSPSPETRAQPEAVPGASSAQPAAPGTASAPGTVSAPATAAPATAAAPGTAAGTTPGANPLNNPLPPRGGPGGLLGALQRSPLNFSLTLGHYREEPSNTRLNRVDMSLDDALPQHSVIKGLDFGGSTRFEQKLTSDGTAQYVININASALHRFSSQSAFNATYYRLQPIGYTPFQFDRPGNTDMSNFGADINLGSQPHAVTTIANQGALGYLSPIGGIGSIGSLGGYGAAGGYSGYSGYGANGGYATYGGAGGAMGPGGYGAGLNGPRSSPAFHLGLHTGFDFNAAREPRLGGEKWSPLSIDMLTFPVPQVTFYATTTYNLIAQRSGFGSTGSSPFTPIRGGFRWIGGRAEFFDSTFVYDPARKQITTVQGHALLPLGRLTSVEALAGYQQGFGGFAGPNSGTFEQVLLSRDLNCFVANFFYSTNPHELSFTISIKAFPIQKFLGVQRFGNLFNQGVGQRF